MSLTEKSELQLTVYRTGSLSFQIFMAVSVQIVVCCLFT